MNESITRLFLEQPLSLPGSAKKYCGFEVRGCENNLNWKMNFYKPLHAFGAYGLNYMYSKCFMNQNLAVKDLICKREQNLMLLGF